MVYLHTGLTNILGKMILKDKLKISLFCRAQNKPVPGGITTRQREIIKLAKKNC